MNNITLFDKFVFINQILKKRNANGKCITQGQGRILAMLNNKEGISTKELANILNIKVPSLNETLNKLQDQGYIEKIPSDEDKRILLIYLTKKGHELKPKPPKDLDIFDCLDEHQKEELNSYLNIISNQLHEKMKVENPEQYEKMLKNHQEFLECLKKIEN